MTTRPADHQADPADPTGPATERPDSPADPVDGAPTGAPAGPPGARGRAARYVGRHRRTRATATPAATSAGPAAASSIQHALPTLCVGVLVVALLTVPAATVPSTGQTPSCPRPSTCGAGPDAAGLTEAEEAEAVIRAVAGRDCLPTTVPRPGTMPSGAVVRDAGSTWVGWLPFDEAWHRAADGRVWTLRYCYGGPAPVTP